MCSLEYLLLCAFLALSILSVCSRSTASMAMAMSITNPDLERYFRTPNISQPFIMSEERIAMDLYTYAYLNYSYGETQVKFDEEKARYGEGKIASVQGKLVHITNADDVNDDYACSTNILGTHGAPTPAAGVEWIALVRRGRCTFEEKVKNVHDKGAYGVIIFNDKPVMNLEKMQIKGKNRNITAVITYQEIGSDMALRLDEGHEVYCIIKEGRSGMRPINSLNRTSVLFVSISFIVLMVISLVWLIFYYIQRFRYLQTKDQQSRQLCSVTKKAIMKIPTKTGKSSDDKDMDSDCCAICIEAYKSSDCIRVLPCKHEFHKNCIDPWLIEHRTCPMCKLDVLKFYGYVVGDQIHSTPSPQHIPPNVAPVNDNDVPVIVVAIPHAAPTSQQQQQQQHQQLSSEPINLMQTTSLLSTASSLDSSSSASSASSTSASSSSMLEQPKQRNKLNCNTNASKHNRNHSCSLNNHHHHHPHQKQQERCCCVSDNDSNTQQPTAYHHQHHTSCNGPLLGNANNTATTNTTCANSHNMPTCNSNVSSGSADATQQQQQQRRNSAPHVLQVSTASRQVTDV